MAKALHEKPKPEQLTQKLEKLSLEIYGRHTQPPARVRKVTVVTVGDMERDDVLERQRAYLKAVSAGFSVSVARDRAGISLAVLRLWQQDPEFVEKEEEAQDDKLGYLEDVAFLRAHESDNVLMKLLEANAPEKYRSNGKQKGGGIQVVINNLTNATPEDRMTITVQGNDDG
jgi:hypothetical protein